jgi:hypothetical protein
MELSMDSKAVLNRIMINGGITIDPNTDHEPTQGYGCAFNGYEMSLKTEGVDPNALANAIETYWCKRPAFSPGVDIYFGCWKTRRGGIDVLVLDYSIVIEDLSEALDFAFANNQEAIQDLSLSGPDGTIAVADYLSPVGD